MRTAAAVAVAGTLVLGSVSAGAEVFGGVDFPAGSAAFADAVERYDPAFGSSTLPDAAFQDATAALGPPDFAGENGFVALGDAGTLVVELTDVVATGSGDASPDLHVFEAGAAEGYLVAASTDGVAFTSVGTLFGSGGIDLDASGFGPDARIRFIQLTDDGDSADVVGPVGADIDAIGAISGIATHDLTIVKVADVSGAYTFEVLVDGLGATVVSVTAGGGGTVATGLPEGQVVVTEQVPAGQRLESVVCTDDVGSAVTVTVADDRADVELRSDTTCTFTNVAVPPPATTPTTTSTTVPGTGRAVAAAPASNARPVPAQPRFTG